MNDRASEILVVLEAGAHWPDWLELWSSGARAEWSLGGSSGTRVIVEQPAEGCRKLAERVAERCEAMRAGRASIAIAIVGCGDRSDAPADLARRSILRSLADAMAGAKGGRLLLTADMRQRGAMRTALCNIARDVTTEWQNAHVTASVRFSDEPMAMRPLARRVA